ncbi:hypothetical protein PseBG33_0006 [Pseudomonas synxantha BG33R]|uniref:argonaute/piwi family protein n=1 Tax=Pseudomonas synxantha TaxID=47883 RepID=UPI00025FEA40|nr:hypothetical protein [Pseudomonas synxantha]EIK71338.1 hypothetical protein PseBG33_0006 [Pseudomonas synxantha BG33R]
MSQANKAKISPFTLLDEPLLTFSPNDVRATDVHPLRGLVNHGPFTKEAFTRYTPKIRVATVGPNAGWIQRGDLMKLLKVPHSPADRKEYVPAFPGFERLFHAELVSAPAETHIRWPDNLLDQTQSLTPPQVLFQAISEALTRLSLMRELFDVVLIHLPDKWSHAFRDTGFDAHDSLKAIGARYSIPTQVVNDRSFKFSFKASIAWRLSIALYVKAGGIPWKLAPSAVVPADTAYIGLAYAIKGNSEKTGFVTCCSQVFDMDGGGMEFVAFQAVDPVTDIIEARRNPFLTRNDMRSVISRSLALYQQRNTVLPRRLVIHKTTAFKPQEIQGAMDALASVKEVEFIEVSSRSHWRGVWLIDSGKNNPPSQAAKYPVPRGTMVMRSGTSALLWAAGNAAGVSASGNYYQGGKSIPRPLALTRHEGTGPLELIAAEVLALTKMDWNNDALYDPMPVTISYSQALARTIANVPDLPGSTYPYRLFM